MIVKLKLSTGKIIELTKEEYEEILNKGIESIWVPFHRIMPDPQPQWEYHPMYPYTTCVHLKILNQEPLVLVKKEKYKHE